MIVQLKLKEEEGDNGQQERQKSSTKYSQLLYLQLYIMFFTRSEINLSDYIKSWRNYDTDRVDRDRVVEFPDYSIKALAFLDTLNYLTEIVVKQEAGKNAKK